MRIKDLSCADRINKSSKMKKGLSKKKKKKKGECKMGSVMMFGAS